MSIPVQLTMGTFPSGYCWAGPQTYANDLVALITAIVPGSLNTFVIGNNVPQPADQNKPWFRLNPDGTPDRWYYYVGSWISQHPVPASAAIRQIYFGTEASVWAYDGGDGNDPSITPPTDTTGAMWKVDHSLDFKIPMGAGTSPVVYDGNPATVLAQGATMGEERQTMQPTEMPAHSHLTNVWNNAARLTPDAATWDDMYGSNGLGAPAAYNIVTSVAGSTLSHQNVPPVKGCFFIARSARRFYSAS